MTVFCQYNNRIVTNNFEPVYICKIIFLKVLFLKWDCWVKKMHTLHWHPAKLPSQRVCPNPQLSNRAYEDSFQTLIINIITFFFYCPYHTSLIKNLKPFARTQKWLNYLVFCITRFQLCGNMYPSYNKWNSKYFQTILL